MITKRHRVSTPMAIGIIFVAALALLSIIYVTTDSDVPRPATTAPTTSAPPVRHVRPQAAPPINRIPYAYVNGFWASINDRTFSMDYMVYDVPTGYNHVLLFMQDDKGGYRYWLDIGTARNPTFSGAIQDNYNPEICRKVVLVLANNAARDKIWKHTNGGTPEHSYKRGEFPTGTLLLQMNGFPTSLPH